MMLLRPEFLLRSKFAGVCEMRSKWTLFSVLALATVAYGKDPKPYQTGKLVQMDSVSCGAAEKEGKLCQEYVVQTERVTYHIRPRDEKHSVLLPAGEPAQFRIAKDRMLLRVAELNGKEGEYVVVSQTPRSDGSAADAMPMRVNHLQ